MQEGEFFFFTILNALKGIWLFLVANAFPIVLGAIVTLILREYFAYKTNFRNERIQRLEKLIENVYGQLVESISSWIDSEKILAKDKYILEIISTEEKKTKEVFTKYAHEINQEIVNRYCDLRFTVVPTEVVIEKLKEILVLVNDEYKFNVSSLERYREMREGFWKNLRFYFDPRSFRDKKKKE